MERLRDCVTEDLHSASERKEMAVLPVVHSVDEFLQLFVDLALRLPKQDDVNRDSIFPQFLAKPDKRLFLFFDGTRDVNDDPLSLDLIDTVFERQLCLLGLGR